MCISVRAHAVLYFPYVLLIPSRGVSVLRRGECLFSVAGIVCSSSRGVSVLRCGAVCSPLRGLSVLRRGERLFSFAGSVCPPLLGLLTMSGAGTSYVLLRGPPYSFGVSLPPLLFPGPPPPSGHSLSRGSPLRGIYPRGGSPLRGIHSRGGSVGISIIPLCRSPAVTG